MKSRNLSKVIYLGVLFSLMFTIFNGLQNIITLLYTQLGYASLGKFTMLSMFVTNAISHLVGPNFADRYPYNYTFFVSTIPIFLFSAVGKFASLCSDSTAKEEFRCSPEILYPLHFVAASCFGFFASILWASQSAYVAECANIHNKGKLFGIFWSFMACSQITGNLFTTVILRYEGASTLFDLYIIIALIGISLFLLVKKPEIDAKTKDEQIIFDYQDYDNVHEHLLPAPEAVCNEAQVPHLTSTEYAKITKPRISLTRFIPFFSHPKILPCIPLFFLQGYAFSTFITNLSVMIFNSLTQGTQSEKNEMVGIAFLVFGITEVIAGQAFGYIFDKFRRYSITIYCIVNLICILSMYTAYITGIYALFLLTSISFAFSDVGGQTTIGGLLALKFTEKVEPFVVFRFMSTCAAALVMGIYMVFPNVNPAITIVGLFGATVGATWNYRNYIQNSFVGIGF